MGAEHVDAVVVGGGANGLVCALVLARAGLSVRVLEGKPALGGGCRTEYPFLKAPRLVAHPGSHRVGFLPAELVRSLGVALPLAPRSPSLFAPRPAGVRGASILSLGGEDFFAALGRFAPEDERALLAMQAELDAIVVDLAPSWTNGPSELDELAHRFVRGAHRTAFTQLCRGSVGAYIDRFGVESEVVKATVAAEALSGAWGSPDTEGTGITLLLHHAARSAGGGGDSIPVGGMGALVRALADAATAAGAVLTPNSNVVEIEVRGNAATGVLLASGELVRADTIVSSADPWRLRALLGEVPVEYKKKIEGLARPGSASKVLLALSALPRFPSAPAGHAGAVTLMLAGLSGGTPLAAMRDAFRAASAGEAPVPFLEMVVPTAGDPHQQDSEGRHHVSLQIPWSPYDLEGTTWAVEEERFLGRVMDLFEAFAPGVRELVVDAQVLHPKKLEVHFGVTRGHAHHVDDAIGFADRLQYPTPVQSLYACGAGCAPAGYVFGLAGYNAAQRVLADLELGLERTEVGGRPAPQV